MLLQIVDNILSHTKYAARELFKVKKIAWLYLLVSFGLMALALTISKHTKVSPEAYPKLVSVLVTCGTDVFFIQLLLLKYRKIKPTLGAMALCFLWSFTFLALGWILSRIGSFIYLEIAPMVFKDHTIYEECIGLLPTIIGLGSLFLVYLIMSCVAFWPMCVFEKAQQPYKKNLKLVAGRHLSVAGTWALIFAVCYFTKSGFDAVMLSESYTTILIAALSFTIYSFFLMIAATSTATAYLRAIGEHGFTGHIFRRARN